MLETAIATGSKRPAIALDTSTTTRTVCPQRSAGLYEAHPGLGRLTWSSALAMDNALPCGVNAPALTFVVPTSTPIRQAFSDIIFAHRRLLMTPVDLHRRRLFVTWRGASHDRNNFRHSVPPRRRQ